MNARTRKAIGCFVLLAYLTIYAGLASWAGAALSPVLPNWAELVFYVVAGIVWIIPLKPLFSWMSRP